MRFEESQFWISQPLSAKWWAAVRNRDDHMEMQMEGDFIMCYITEFYLPVTSCTILPSI